jgi:hypothetical protein
MTEIAKTNMRLDKGVAALCEDWEDFDEIMSDSNATASDIKEVLPGINEGLKDILDMSDE